MQEIKARMFRFGWIIGVILIGVSTVHGQATLSLPQTGQKMCYDSRGAEVGCRGTGQDGENQAGVAWPTPRFTNPDGSTPIDGPLVVDQLTGLQWTRDAGTPAAGPCVEGPKEWQKAMDYVRCLNQQNYLGYSDWRLPNINEIESLIHSDWSNAAAWLNSQGFLNVASDSYWTSTGSDGIDVDVWSVFLLSGLMHTSYKWNYFYYVWPVRTGQAEKAAAPLWKTGQTHTYREGDDGDLRRGVPWPDPRFTDHGDGTVTDHLTGRMWTKEADPSGPPCKPAKKTWQAALDSVACLNTHRYLGYTDWRLPNKKELFSLIDYSKDTPALPAGHPFLNLTSGLYWSSTTFANTPDYAWFVNLGGGNVGSAVKSFSQNVFIWPVRMPAPKPPEIDLTGVWASLRTTCHDTGRGPRCQIQGTLRIQNLGTRDAPSAVVLYYLSDQEKPGGKETFLKKGVSGRIESGETKLKTLIFRLRTGENASGKYLIAVIDPGNHLMESHKENNTIVFGPIP